MRALRLFWVIWIAFFGIGLFLLGVVFPGKGPGDIGYSLNLIAFLGLSVVTLIALLIASLLVALRRPRHL